mgnify:CR=1 FL=1
MFIDHNILWQAHLNTHYLNRRFVYIYFLYAKTRAALFINWEQKVFFCVGAHWKCWPEPRIPPELSRVGAEKKNWVGEQWWQWSCTVQTQMSFQTKCRAVKPQNILKTRPNCKVGNKIGFPGKAFLEKCFECMLEFGRQWYDFALWF